jgi:hypothetical protein
MQHTWKRPEISWYKILVGKYEGRRTLRRSKARWINNIKMDIEEIGCEEVEYRVERRSEAVNNLAIPTALSCRQGETRRLALHVKYIKSTGKIIK